MYVFIKHKHYFRVRVRFRVRFRVRVRVSVLLNTFTPQFSVGEPAVRINSDILVSAKLQLYRKFIPCFMIMIWTSLRRSAQSVCAHPHPARFLTEARALGNAFRPTQVFFLNIIFIIFFLLSALSRRANARNVRLYYPHWQDTDLFIIPFVSLLCLRSTLRFFYLLFLSNIYSKVRKGQN